MIPDGWNLKREDNNNQHYIVIIDKNGMIPGGWNSPREASDTRHNPGPVEDAMEEKEMIPGGWNSHREDSNSQHDFKKKIYEKSCKGDNIPVYYVWQWIQMQQPSEETH